MMAVSAQTTTIHVAIATWPWPSYFSPAEKLKGIRLDIARYKRPRGYRIVAALPKNNYGKILKTELRDWLIKVSDS